MVGSFASGPGGDLVLSLRRLRTATALSLSTSRREISFGGAVTVTARLGAFEDPSSLVSIYRTPYGGRRTLVARGPANTAGAFSVTVTPQKRTSFVAEWEGDDGYLPATSATRIVGVHVVTTTRMSGHYRTSGRYKLFHEGDVVRHTGRVAPNHAGKPLRFVAQAFLRGAWRTIATGSFRIRAAGSVTAYLGGLPRGVNFRARNEFRGDADHLGDSSPWQYFRWTA
jgi:hypothetical protein